MAIACTGAVKVVIRGQISTVQSWSIGFWLQSSIAITQAGLSAVATGGGAFQTYYTTNLKTALQNLMNANGGTTKISYYGFSGNTDTQTAFVEDPQVQAGSGSGNCPPQSSLVATLQTAGFGRAYRGRMYVPCLGAALVSGQAPSASTSALANGLGNYFIAFNAGGTYVPSLASFSRSAFSQITNVRVDSIVDTQRRRRDKLAALITSNHAAL